MSLITPQDAPYAFWSHIKTFRGHSEDSSIPQIRGLPYSRDLVFLIAGSRPSSRGYSTAARTARLMINRWEPSPDGERQSRPGYNVLVKIREEALRRQNYPFLIYPDTPNNFNVLLEFLPYRIPHSTLISSLFPLDSDERSQVVNFANHVADYILAGALVFVFQSLPSGRDVPYLLTAYAVWISNKPFPHSELDIFAS